MEKNLNNISKDKFEFVQQDEKLFDKPPETKPIGFYKDAWYRFKKNKASVVAACIILALTLFSIFAPLVAPYNLAFSVPEYSYMPPKNLFASAISEKTTGQMGYENYLAIGVGAADYDIIGKRIDELPNGRTATIEEGFQNPYTAVIEFIKTEEAAVSAKRYTYTLDAYKAVGFLHRDLTPAEYNDMKAWEAETGLPLIFPIADISNSQFGGKFPNIWYKVDAEGRAINSEGQLRKDTDEFVHNYILNSDGTFADYIEQQGGYRKVRVLAENWFIYTYGKTPTFWFGTNAAGQDIFVRLAYGIRTSLILGISVTLICFLIGSVIGATQGYYGGWFDMITERIIDILIGLPFGIVLILVRFYWITPGLIAPFTALLIAYIVLGWIGDAGAMRGQFYRFKNQEYVLAARTLGAKDRRIMFRHILPNAWGTIITGLALSIPLIILSETTLSYLGIINLDGPNSASIGAMLADGTSGNNLLFHTHIVLFPAIVISLLMISFNLFGNGLRDAFNPQLRGAEE